MHLVAETSTERDCSSGTDFKILPFIYRLVCADDVEVRSSGWSWAKPKWPVYVGNTTSRMNALDLSSIVVVLQVAPAASLQPDR